MDVTGFSVLAGELNPKRLELMSELVPQSGVIALLVNPSNPNAERIIRDVEKAAGDTGLQLPVLRDSTEGEIDAAFATLVQLQAGALVVGADSFFNSRGDQLVALAARHAVPAIYFGREFAAAGGLISYGPSVTGMYHQVGAYVGRILADAKPVIAPIGAQRQALLTERLRPKRLTVRSFSSGGLAIGLGQRRLNTFPL